MTKKKQQRGWLDRLIESIVTTIFWSVVLGFAAAFVAHGQGWDPLMAGSIVAFSTVGVSGALMFAIRYQLLNLDVLEKRLGIDINRDGHIGTPKKARPKAATLDAKQTAVLKLLRLILAGKPFTWRAVGKTCKLSRASYNECMEGLLERGIIRWKGSSPQQGRELASAKKLKALIADLEPRPALTRPAPPRLAPPQTMEAPPQGGEQYYIEVEADSPTHIFESRRR